MKILNIWIGYQKIEKNKGKKYPLSYLNKQNKHKFQRIPVVNGQALFSLKVQIIDPTCLKKKLQSQNLICVTEFRKLHIKIQELSAFREERAKNKGKYVDLCGFSKYP